MKKFLPGLLIGLVLGVALTWLLTPHGGALPAVEKPAAVSEEKTPASGGLHFTPEQIATARLEVATPTLTLIAPEVEAYGRVLDPTPLVAAAAEIATARAALTASEKEFARVKSLHDQGENASAQAVETANAAAQHDRVQLASARARFTAAWGPALAAKLHRGLITEAVEKGWAFARLDLPPGSDAVVNSPSTAEVSLLTGNESPRTAEVIGPAPTADAQLQGRGYLVLLRDTPPPVGAALHGTLPGAGAPKQFPVLPRSAFVRHEGSVFVFVQTSAGSFKRRHVELGRRLADGVAVTEGIDEKTSVVISGAQQLLSTELGAAGDGD